MAHCNYKCAIVFAVIVKCSIFVVIMVSIIVPVYNLEALIQRCVDSVKAQTVSDWELVMVNDGSTDGSGRLCDVLASNDDRIHVIHQKNAGAGAARKAGVAMAKGEWVLMLDGDDVLPPNALELFLSRVTDDVDIIVGSVKQCTDSGNYPHLMEQSRTLNGREYIKALLNGETSVGPWAKLMRRSLFLNGQWIPHRHITHFEDLLMLVSVSGDARKVVIDSSLNVYNLIYRVEGLSHTCIMSFEGWYRLFNGISRFADEETALRFKLHRLYDGCIVRGVEFESSNPEIKAIMHDARRFKLSGHDKLILLMLRSKRLRRYVAKRHQDTKRVSGAVKVSVVMSAYNEAHHIERAMLSVLRQSFRNIELIVVDDASTDNTLDVIRTVAAVDSRVRILRHEENMGLSASRHTGWKEALGDYVQFVDGSDTLNPYAIERMYDQAKMSGAEIIVMAMQRVSRFMRLKIPYFVPSKVFKEETVLTTELLPLIFNRNGFSHSLCDKLFLRDVLVKVNPLVEPNFHGEDFLTIVRIFSHKYEVSYTDYVGYNWYMGGRSSSLNYYQVWEDNRFQYESSRDLLTELNLTDVQYKISIAKGLADGVINNIARYFANPFRSQEKLAELVSAQLLDPVWESVLPYLDGKYKAIKDKNIDEVIALGKERYKKSWLFYSIMLLMGR
ncbi:MAG: glycosyltransferase family 2 protein [Bacteroidales bacterium]|nr:glycosyltransferase family 2 protein [Bacteroidales bacterium]